MMNNIPTPPPARRSADPRPARTRAAILNAIQTIDLHEQELTVSSIVAHAGIARSSFYSQFTDIGDVAVQLIREVYGKIDTLDAQYRLSGEGLTAATETIGVLIDAMVTHKKLYAAVLGANVSHDAHREILRIMAHGALPALRASNHPEVNEIAAANYLAGGVLNMLTEWLLAEDPMPATEIQQHIVYMLPAWIRTNTPTLVTLTD